jgi:hypothetical protein
MPAAGGSSGGLGAGASAAAAAAGGGAADGWDEDFEEMEDAAEIEVGFSACIHPKMAVSVGLVDTVMLLHCNSS